MTTDYDGAWKEALEHIANPVAVVMAAHLTAQQTRPEDPRRFRN